MKNQLILCKKLCSFSRQRFRMALIIFGFVFAGETLAQQSTPKYTELDPGLVLDLTGNVAYLMNADGTLSSLNLNDGKSMWSTSEKGKPLAIINNQLLVQLEDSVPSNNFNIAYLNGADGNVVRTEKRLLPNGILSGIKSTMNYSFDTRLSIVNDQLNLSWDYQPTIFRGSPLDNPAVSSNKGVFRVDKTNLTMANLPITNFSLDATNISKELDSAALINRAGRKFSSIQDDYIVSIERVSNDSQWEKYLWTVYTSSGSKVGSIRSNLSFRPFYVVDNTLVFTTVPVIRNVDGKLVEEPKSLVGYDLNTGRQIWSKEILDLEYRGPYPP